MQYDYSPPSVQDIRPNAIPRCFRQKRMATEKNENNLVENWASILCPLAQDEVTSGAAFMLGIRYPLSDHCSARGIRNPDFIFVNILNTKHRRSTLADWILRSTSRLHKTIRMFSPPYFSTFQNPYIYTFPALCLIADRKNYFVTSGNLSFSSFTIKLPRSQYRVLELHLFCQVIAHPVTSRPQHGHSSGRPYCSSSRSWNSEGLAQASSCCWSASRADASSYSWPAVCRWQRSGRRIRQLGIRWLPTEDGSERGIANLGIDVRFSLTLICRS